MPADSVAGIRDFHLRLAGSAVLEGEAQLRRNGAHQFDSAGQVELLRGEREGALAGRLDGGEITSRPRRESLQIAQLSRRSARLQSIESTMSS